MSHKPHHGKSSLAALTLGALGVVYGDIGTSPLYALREVFATKHATLSQPDVLGVLSLVFWTLPVIVSLKYVTLIMRANNNGEGGTMALMALASQATRERVRLRNALIVMGILGAALFYGDGVITPAISVLSAVEGLEVATPAFKPYVVPITLAVLTALYAVQRFGTGAMGRWFGPFTIVWFVVIGFWGLVWIVRAPIVLAALNPWHAVSFGIEHGRVTLLVLGAVFLAVTGAEALYADMGHFGRKPIQLAWFVLVFPALVLNYFGQGALMLLEPAKANNPFFNMVPGWFLIPMVVMATLATVIASQATISGTFSVTKQAIQLGYLPRLRVLHTSVRETGQVYIPGVNWLQYAAIVAAVLYFGSSSALATAYGIAVTATMVLTTVMTFFVLRYRWHYSLWLSLFSTGFFLAIELVFFASNILKVFSGGWFTLLIAAFVFTVMMTWARGRELLGAGLRADAIELKPFLKSVLSHPPMRAPGTAVFMNGVADLTPTALLHNLKHNHVLHETNLFVTVHTLDVPWVPFAQRATSEQLCKGAWAITLNFGFKNDVDVPVALALLKGHGFELDPMSTSYFLSRATVVPTLGQGMAPWREKLFASMHRNAASAADFLNLPPNRVVELGTKVQIWSDHVHIGDGAVRAHNPASASFQQSVGLSNSSSSSKSGLAGLVLAATGVVYGDIGTSPLYALKEVFAHGHVPMNAENIYGVLSLVFWTLTIVVSLKYVLLILRADNNGEGGLIAMLALASQAVRGKPTLRKRLLFLGIFGTAIFFGDGVITPAISVLSAVEGLEVAAPALHTYVIPVTLMVLTALFMVQRRGTASVGKLFGPVMVLWFGVLAVLGLMHVVQNPAILAALSPTYALTFLVGNPKVAFIALGSVVLCVTGAEALYADMGHFGKRPIRLAWFSLAMPALVLNYFGQGAMLLEHPGNVGNPFFEMAPTWALYPLIGLATCATVIASQALITAAFSVTKQAIQLGYLPRLRLLHTSVREAGQIYVPFVNWSLYLCIVVAVLVFGSTSKLAAAYGIAVTIDMLITTTMTFFVIRYGWKYPWSLSFAATGFFFVVDFVYFSANVVKVFEGGWFPVAIGGVMFILMMTWKQGRKLMSTRLREDAIDLKSFLEAVFVSPPTRVEGTAVFLVSDQGLTPNALLHNLKHNKVLHATNLFVTVKQHELPWIDLDKRSEMEPLGHDCWQVTLNFGFKNEPDVPQALSLLRSGGCTIDEMGSTSYFLSRDIVMPTMGGGMADWREKLFASMHRNASAAADFLSLPTNRVVELGSKVEI